MSDYDTGEVKKLDGSNDKKYLSVRYIQAGTGKELSVLFSVSDISVGDEIEFIRNQKNQTIALRNITRNKTIKHDSSIRLPHEIFHINDTLAHDMWKLEKYHKKISSFERVEQIYAKYIYLVQSGSTKRGARDPNNPSNFKTTKLYIQNARNILFFYYSYKAKELILELHQDNKNFTIEQFKQIINEFYSLFLLEFKGIPMDFQSYEEFENQLAGIKHDIGLS